MNYYIRDTGCYFRFQGPCNGWESAINTSVYLINKEPPKNQGILHGCSRGWGAITSLYRAGCDFAQDTAQEATIRAASKSSPGLEVLSKCVDFFCKLVPWQLWKWQWVTSAAVRVVFSTLWHTCNISKKQKWTQRGLHIGSMYGIFTYIYHKNRQKM